MAPQGSDLAAPGHPPVLEADGTSAPKTLSVTGSWTIETLKDARQSS